MVRVLTFFVATAAFLNTAKADVIGVHLEDQSEEDGKKPEGADELVTQQFDSILRLNRYTFHNTILEEHEDPVTHWIVLFCPPWFEPCQAIAPIFREFSAKWQEQLNGALLSTEVRFATVDCATEKALCNTQNVDTYPLVAHYRKRQQVRLWRGKSFDTDRDRLQQFLQKELGPVAAALSTLPESNTLDETPEDAQNFRVDFLLIFAAIAGNAWFISRSSSVTEAPAKVSQSQPAAPHAPKQQPAEGSVLPASPQASCVARSLPKEWGQERPSLEL